MFSTEITSPTEARAGFFQSIDRVAQSHQICIINRRDGENVALIAETVYLFRSPANALHLFDSIDEYRSGKLVSQSIKELRQELGIDGEEEEKI